MGISGQRARDIVARLIVAILGGIAVGYFFGRSVASDAALGRTLTLKEYIADFENHRRTLLRNDIPMWAALLTMVVLMLVFFGVYELLVVAVDRALRALDRRRGGDVIE